MARDRSNDYREDVRWSEPGRVTSFFVMSPIKLAVMTVDTSGGLIRQSGRSLLGYITRPDIASDWDMLQRADGSVDGWDATSGPFVPLRGLPGPLMDALAQAIERAPSHEDAIRKLGMERQVATAKARHEDRSEKLKRLRLDLAGRAGELSKFVGRWFPKALQFDDRDSEPVLVRTILDTDLGPLSIEIGGSNILSMKTVKGLAGWSEALGDRTIDVTWNGDWQLFKAPGDAKPALDSVLAEVREDWSETITRAVKSYVMREHADIAMLNTALARLERQADAELEQSTTPVADAAAPSAAP